MLTIPKQKYFYYIALILMATTFFPLLSYYLPRYIRSHHLWTTIWIISLLIYYPNIFLTRAMKYLLIYGLFLFIVLITIWSKYDNWNFGGLLEEFYEIAIGISVFTYFQHIKDWVGLAKITKWSLIFLFITAIMTIYSSAIDPMYARNIVGVSAVSNESEREAIMSFQRFGGGNYGTAQVFMCLFPIFIYYYKNIRISLISKKQIIIYSIFIFFALLGMQIFGNILIATLFSVVALLGMKKIKQSILVIGLLFSITLIIPKDVYVNSLLSISDQFDQDSELNFKFRDFATFIETGANIEDNSTETGARAERYPILIENFVKSPLLGYYYLSDIKNDEDVNAGGHLYWMYKLTITGIIGFIFFIFIPYSFIKNNLRYFDSTYKFYYILASCSILCYGLIKNLGGRDTWYAFFIILPGLYYLPLLKNKQQVKRFK